MSQVDADNLFQQIYDRNLGDLMGKRAHDAETKRIVDSKKMKECTFKPKKISKVRYENGLTFDERQAKWAQYKLEKKKHGMLIADYEANKECTFIPEILIPDNHKTFDPEFYERQ